MTEGRLPNFFIVGVPKAGTTSLYHHLSAHPEVYMSPLKETSYFSPEFRVERLAASLQPLGRRSAESLREYLDAPPLGQRFGGMVAAWEDYCRLFAGVREERAVGEASPGYLWSPSAAREIVSRIPDARIIMILRNPMERAFSQYLQMSNTGFYRLSFEAHIEACLANRRTDEISMVHPFLEYGLYSAQVQRYRDTFPSERLGVWLYEDTRAADFLGEVYRFLGVESSFRPDTSKRHLEQQVPRVRWLKRLLAQPAIAAGLRAAIPQAVRPLLRRVFYRKRQTIQMSERARAMLTEYYRVDVQRLEGMLGRDLSGWVR